MKTTILSILFTISLAVSANQDITIAVFSSSYKFESYQQYDKAIEALMKVYDVKSYEINLRLGWLQYLKGEQTESVKYYQKAQTIKPKSIEALLGITYPQAAMSNWTELTNTYEQIIKLDSKNQTANYRLAEIHFNGGKFSKAENYLKVVLESYPFDYYSNVLMAKIKTKSGNISAAKAHYNKALLSNPDNVEILKALVKLQ